MKLYRRVWIGGIALLTAIPLATEARTFKEIVDKEIAPLGDKLIELLYALCFIVFLIGMVRFFFSHNAEKRDSGKKFAIYGIIGLFVLFAVWGIVHVLLNILTDFAA